MYTSYEESPLFEMCHESTLCYTEVYLLVYVKTPSTFATDTERELEYFTGRRRLISR